MPYFKIMQAFRRNFRNNHKHRNRSRFLTCFYSVSGFMRLLLSACLRLCCASCRLFRTSRGFLRGRIPCGSYGGNFQVLNTMQFFCRAIEILTLSIFPFFLVRLCVACYPNETTDYLNFDIFHFHQLVD